MLWPSARMLFWLPNGQVRACSSGYLQLFSDVSGNNESHTTLRCSHIKLAEFLAFHVTTNSI